MKDLKYKQCALCEGNTLAESVEIFNKEMKRLANFNPTYERYGDNFIIYYTCIEREPESLAEEMELKGCDHRCIECNHCERPKNRSGEFDGRAKKAMCLKKGCKVFIDGRVCDEFYKEQQQDRKFELIGKTADIQTEESRKGA